MGNGNVAPAPVISIADAVTAKMESKTADKNLIKIISLR
jgi:hypothetical protein